MPDLHWKTAITNIEPNSIMLRGYPLDELMGKVSFAGAIYLALRGELPSPEVGRLIDAILVSSIDHGATPPSALSAITVASTGAPLSAAVASGVLAISKFHGGAVEDCMRIVLETKGRIDGGKSVDEAAAEIVAEYRAAKKRISGFGHRIHTSDPRTKKLFTLTSEANTSGDHIETIRVLESALEENLGKRLPINVDGAIAAVLCELDFYPELGNAFFIMARVPGLIAHAAEERERQKPMRRIHPTDQEYDGPPERHIDE